MPTLGALSARLPRHLRSTAILAAGLAATAGLGLIDHATGPDLSFILFYLLPVFLVAWYGGLAGGLATAAAAAVAWYAADWLHAPWDFRLIWNLVEKLAFFALFAGLVARLKRAALAVYEHELDIARDVQRGLFPARLPAVPGLELAVRLVPNRALSGDYYDLFPRGRRVGFVVADVMGKGLPASLLTANLHALLHYAERLELPAPLAERVASVHRHLLRHSPGRYVTLVLGEIDVDAGRIETVVAGHPPPLLWTGAAVERLDSTGPVVGLGPATRWQTRTHDLPRGALLLAHTDGVSEATDAAGRELGSARLAELVETAGQSGASADEVARRVLDALRSWTGRDEWDDDVAILVARRV